MTEAAVVVRDFRKRYGAMVAVDGISFEAEAGEVFGLLGPNGAGKTSTLECLEGIRFPDGGSLQVMGIDPTRDGRRLRDALGVLVVTAFACGGIGALFGVISANSRATVLWSQLVFLPSMLIGGLMIPLSMLPPGIQPLSALLPSTQAMQAIQGLAYGRETLIPPLAGLAALAGGALFSFGLATYLFNWDTRNASRRGHPAMALLAWIPYALTILVT